MQANSIPCTGYSFWDQLRNFYTNLRALFCQFISWTNLVNSGKFMDNCWTLRQVMGDMKKVYNHLIVINLCKLYCIRNMRNATSERLWPYCGTLSVLCTFLRIILLCDKSLWWLKCTTTYNYIKLLPLPTSKWSNFQFASPILCKKLTK